MLAAVKVRIYPHRQQRTALAKAFGCTRWAWNEALAQNQRTYRETGKGIPTYQLKKRLPQLKREHPWLKDAPSQALQQAILNLKAAFDNFFQGRAKLPQFKSKRGRQSVQFPQGVKLGERCIYLPKVGWVKARFHRPLVGRLKTVTVSQTPRGHYHAALLLEDGTPQPEPSADGKAVGIDLGLTEFAVTSDGVKLANPRHLARHEANLKRKQRKLARKTKGSNGWRKLKQQVAAINERIANARRDWIHKCSRRLADENQAIFAEHLNVKGMMANHKLARTISDVGWSSFRPMLAYKAEQEGKIYREIDRFFPSSKTCSTCARVVEHLPVNVRYWQCPDCGQNHDRDICAAINIRNEGIRQLASGTEATASGGGVSPCRTDGKAAAVEAGSRSSRAS